MARSAVATATRVEPQREIEGARTGRIVGVDRQGRILVDYQDNSHGPVPAALMKTASGRDDAFDWRAGQEVVLLFRDNASNRPVILGLLPSDEETRPALAAEPRDLVVRVDGQRVRVEGREEIVLQCGEASITLCCDGTIAIRGTTVESRARYTNRIRGGSIELN